MKKTTILMALALFTLVNLLSCSLLEREELVLKNDNAGVDDQTGDQPDDEVKSYTCPIVLTPKPGTYAHDIAITLSSDLKGAYIFYIIDEKPINVTSPDRGYIQYKGPIELKRDGTSLYIATFTQHGEKGSSEVKTAEYHINYSPVR